MKLSSLHRGSVVGLLIGVVVVVTVVVLDKWSKNSTNLASEGGQSKAVVDERYNRARKQAQEGNGADALRDYLWCLDRGMINRPDYAGVRTSFLMRDIANLGSKFPPAIIALKDRRDVVLHHIEAGSLDETYYVDFRGFNRVLGDEDKTLDLFSSFESTDARRSLLGIIIFNDLVKKHRYKDAVSVRPYNDMMSRFKRAWGAHRLAASEGVAARAKKGAVADAVRDIEALVGAGEVIHARELAALVLSHDSSDETYSSLTLAASRAGYLSELVPKASPVLR